MTDKLPPPVLLTEKQAMFVEGLGRGVLAKDAYRLAYETEADDNAVRADASKLKRNPAVALALGELLRSKRVQDIDSVGQVISDTLEDQDSARQDGAHASVAAFARMRGNWQGIERQGIVFAAESLLSDDELIQRLAGDDPERIAAAKTLLGAAEGFPEGEPIDTEFEEIATHIVTHDDDASIDVHDISELADDTT
jgi:hypothetical protein